VEHWQGHLTFFVSEMNNTANRIRIDTIENRTIGGVAAATTATYALTLYDDGDILEDIMVKIWAKVVQAEEDGAMAVQINSNFLEDFKYIPKARIEKETANVKRRREEEEELIEKLGKFDILVEDHRLAQTTLTEENASLTSELERVSAVFLLGFSNPSDRVKVFEAVDLKFEEQNRQVQELLQQFYWTDADLQVRRNAALDLYLRRHNQDQTYGNVPLVGVLAELTCIQDENMASAVAALLDDELQALVVNTEEEVETLRNFCVTNDMSSLKIISLQSAASSQSHVSEERAMCASRASKYKATLAYDLIRFPSSASDTLIPSLEQLWWHVLQGAIIFNSVEQMLAYKQEFGRTAAFVVPGAVGWRVDSRFFTLCRENVLAACKLSVQCAPEESMDYKSACGMLDQLSGARTALEQAARAADEAAAVCCEKERQVQEYKKSTNVEALQASLKEIRGDAKKAKTSGPGDLVDLTQETSSDDE
jgi:hypothetical protein